MNTDKLNEYPNSKENEKDLANKILDFYDRYDPYWSFGTANDDLASTIMQLKNSDTRQKLIDNLQRIIATEKKSPCMSSNSFISLAEQLKNEITNYGMEILDTSKKNIMEENTMENQQTQSTAAKTAYAIGQKAQEQGITFSAKFDGDNSAVTVDGVKNKAFVDAVKAEFNIVDKINYVEDISDKIQDAIDNGELDVGKNEQSIGQER